MLKKLIFGGAGLGAFLSTVGGAFAQTPPVADTAVVAATTNAITGLQGSLLENLATLIPIAAVLLITVAVVFFVIRHFRAIVHA